jgi:putative hydrolase of the HAD superfamily
VTRAVFFDAGNTLVRMNYPAIAGELARHGVRVSPEDVQRAEWRARVRLDTEHLAPGEASTEAHDTAGRYQRYVLAALGVTDEAIVAAMVDWRRGYNPPLGLWTVAEPKAAEALAAVRDAGLGAAVISNSNGTVEGILQGLGLAGRLDFVLDSSRVGVEKPDPRIFRLALARAGVTAAEAVYVGDLYSVDVLGARAAGMDAVLLDPGACWGERDCRTAPDVLGAVRLILGRPRKYRAGLSRSAPAPPARCRALGVGRALSGPPT